MSSDIKQRLDSLKDKIRDHDYKYYVLTDPVISDKDYDTLVKKLEKLESQHPELITPDSPTQKVGADLTTGSKLVKHLAPMLSIQNEKDLEKFDASIRKKLSPDDIVEYIVEPKYIFQKLSMLINRNYVELLHSKAQLYLSIL